MLFNSIEFLLFLPLAFAGYWLIRSVRWQNIYVCAVSYLFYGSWDWRFLGLLILTTASSYLSGRLIETRPRTRRFWCVANITLNLGILGFFKYFNFFGEGLKAIFGQFGFQLDWFTIEVLLPVGISFYTFQAISYPIDVYRGAIRATRNPVAFAAYIAFFPQLVAGPIERSTRLLPQFLSSRHFDAYEATDGCRRMLWGFFKKIVIADNCAYLANLIFDGYADASQLSLWLGALMFTFQIYCDFSGYCDIAIGCAKLFGITLSRNFDNPYLSDSLADFWRRWHISLGAWLRDYIYIPLGGSRRGRLRTVLNTMIVFGLSGLWHGADLTFVVWGLYHGLLLVPRVFFRKRDDLRSVEANCRIKILRKLSGIVVTFLLVVIGWVIFRAESLTQAWQYLKACAAGQDGLTSMSYFDSDLGRLAYITIGFIVIMVMTELLNRRRAYALARLGHCPMVLRWMVYMALTAVIILFAGPDTDFIYFQF